MIAGKGLKQHYLGVLLIVDRDIEGSCQEEGPKSNITAVFLTDARW